MESLITFFDIYLDKLLFGIIILSGIYITKYTEAFPKIKSRYKVLFMSIIAAVVMYLIEDGGRLTLPRYIFTYFAATSFYEIIVKLITDKIKNKFGAKDDEEGNINIQPFNGGELPPSKPPKRPNT